MTPSAYQVRRANLDDLDALRALWAIAHLPAHELEKRLTEFQVIQDAEGKVVASLGFTMHHRYALIHSESFANPADADELRPLFWTRLNSLILNHGINRLWTPGQSGFWTQNGFQRASEQILQKLPPAWAAADASWLTLSIKDEEAVQSMEKEMAAWMAAERQNTANKLEQAKTIKTIVTVVAVLVTIGVLFAAFLLCAKRHALPPQ
jgi:N-acetylglutamate synthase-like GNAT family acetyltransferase